MSRFETVVKAEKSVKVTLYTGADDPDLPAHVKALPVGLRSRWVNSYNWGVHDTMDNKEALEQADAYTNMSVRDMLEAGLISVKEMAQPVAPVESAVAQGHPRVQLGPPRAPSFLERIMGRKAAPAPGSAGTFLLYKGTDGVTRTLMVYSNQFQDKEKETFSEASHKEYAEAAEAGEAPYPDLHLWHGGPLTKWGTVETVSYVGGFAIAGGVVDPGKEAVALKLKEMADKGELAVSFGYLGLRGSDDTYQMYRPFEISPLPVGSEANPWTAPIDFKENSMAFSDKKKGWFRTNFGMDDAQIAAAEKEFEGMGLALKAAGITYKEGTGETPAPPTPPDPPPTPPTPTPPPPAPVSAAVQADTDGGIGPQLGAMAGAIKELATALGTVVADVKALKEGAPAATAAAAEQQILARIAGGPGHSPASSPANVVTGLKEQDDDWFKTAVSPALAPYEAAFGGGSAIVGGNAGAPFAPPVPAANGAGGGEVK